MRTEGTSPSRMCSRSPGLIRRGSAVVRAVRPSGRLRARTANRRTGRCARFRAAPRPRPARRNAHRRGHHRQLAQAPSSETAAATPTKLYFWPTCCCERRCWHMLGLEAGMAKGHHDSFRRPAGPPHCAGDPLAHGLGDGPSYRAHMADRRQRQQPDAHRTDAIALTDRMMSPVAASPERSRNTARRCAVQREVLEGQSRIAGGCFSLDIGGQEVRQAASASSAARRRARQPVFYGNSKATAELRPRQSYLGIDSLLALEGA